MDLLAHLFRRDRAGKSVEPPVELSPLEAGQLSSVFTPPRWLRDLGRTSWLLVGLFLLVVGIIWLLGTTQTIVGPVVAATIVATVMAPLVRLLTAHRLPRAAAAAIVLLGVATLAFLVVLVVIGGITSQGTVIGRHATDAANKAEGWLKDLDLNESGASTAKSGVEKDVPKIISALTTGVIHGIQGVTSIVFGLSLAALSLFFLLKDGPSMRAWIDRHLGVPQPLRKRSPAG